MIMNLSNGHSIPTPGFGTFKIPDGEVCINAVCDAITAGYTHIDTAAVYGNERSVGEGVRKSGKAREELFITSKVWNTERGYDTTLRACEKTLKDLGMDYLDLYLIHWPANRLQFGDKAESINVETWKAMERLADEGLVRSIGVSNFCPHHLAPILASANLVPAVDQIEFHPGLLQEDTMDICRQNQILVEAWSPLGRGRLLDDPLLVEVAACYGKTTAQIVLRWVMQKNVLPLVKSTHIERIRENLQIFDFELTAEDVARIDSLPENRLSRHPDEVEF